MQIETTWSDNAPTQPPKARQQAASYPKLQRQKRSLAPTSGSARQPARLSAGMSRLFSLALAATCGSGRMPGIAIGPCPESTGRDVEPEQKAARCTSESSALAADSISMADKPSLRRLTCVRGRDGGKAQ